MSFITAFIALVATFMSDFHAAAAVIAAAYDGKPFDAVAARRALDSLMDSVAAANLNNLLNVDLPTHHFQTMEVKLYNVGLGNAVAAYESGRFTIESNQMALRLFADVYGNPRLHSEKWTSTYYVDAMPAAAAAAFRDAYGAMLCDIYNSGNSDND